MAGKRVLITGASGFVGANLARLLVRDGHAVHLILRPAHTAWRTASLAGAAEFHLVDLLDLEALQTTVRQIRPEWIFHLAAYGAYSFQEGFQKIVRANINATTNLLEATAELGFDAFVNTGSSSEYGLKQKPAAETDKIEPNSTYAVAKAAATLLCRQVAQDRNLPIVTLRLYSAYGPFEDPSRLIPSLIRSGFAGQLPPLAAPQTARDFVHVDDVCDAYVAAAMHQVSERGAAINVGTGVQTRLDEIVSIVRDLLSIREQPQWQTMSSRTWDTDTWVADASKAEAVLDWRATKDIRQGVARTITWYRDNPTLLDLRLSAANDRQADVLATTMSSR
jgi:nucleoside-diphosphate-sugar epimerase